MSAPTPYFADDHVALYHGDFRDLAPLVLDGREPDLTVADPPYGETALDWDRWPDGWPSLAPGRSLWCFGSMRMFLDRRDEFAGWRMSQDLIWEKNRGSNFAADRFSRVHEVVTHWYRGSWGEVHHEPPRTTYRGPDKSAKWDAKPKGHLGARGAAAYVDDGTRLARSIVYATNLRGKHPINETEKPVGLLDPLITYGCPVGGLVIDLFAGSCSTLVAARAIGRRAIGFELRESQCEAAARRLSQGDLFAGSA